MKNLNLKKIAAAILTVAVLLTTTACAARQKPAEDTAAEPQTTQQTTVPDAEQQTFRIGICNYVDDASLNQIVENIQTRLAELGEENSVQFEIDYDNCNADATVMEQIIANFQSNGADLLVGVATPVAMRMQTATEDSRTPVVFAAVSDPVGAGLVQSLEAPRHIWTKRASHTSSTPAAQPTKSCWPRRPWSQTVLTQYLPRPITPS